MNRITWTENMLGQLLALRESGCGWRQVGNALGVSPMAALNFSRSMGQQSDAAPRQERPEYEGALPPGHPYTWSLLIKGTCLEGSAYDHR